MAVRAECTVIARLRPKEGAEQRLLAIRDDLIADFRDGLSGFVSATLCRVADSDEWRDIVVFADRAAADAAHIETPVYKEWDSMVDLLGYEILDHVSHHEA